METTAGIFNSVSDAREAQVELKAAGVPVAHIQILIPGTGQEAHGSVPTDTAESPGMGKALGAVVGGGIGAGGGMGLGSALASALIPGIGPVIAVGVAGAALLGTLGAVLGAETGEAIEEHMERGLPYDELFVYEDALRRGRPIVVVEAETHEAIDRAREIMKKVGAEGIDSARENWWVGIRDAEALYYQADGGDFAADETAYRQGYEAALRRDIRGKDYNAVAKRLRSCFGNTCEHHAFRRGYVRGQLRHSAPDKAASTTTRN